MSFNLLQQFTLINFNQSLVCIYRNCLFKFLIYHHKINLNMFYMYNVYISNFLIQDFAKKYFYHLDKLNLSQTHKKFYFLTYTKPINKFLTLHFIYYWFKLTFRGKGFRVRKFLKSSKITFNFGHSHWTKLQLNNKFVRVKKIRRQNYIWLITYVESWVTLRHIIKFVKHINRYTKRGLRLKKQSIKKRFGKISQLTSSLHF